MLDPTSWQTDIESATASATLKFEYNCKSRYLAAQLKLDLILYEDGILRMVIDEDLTYPPPKEGKSYKTRLNLSS
jgi:hypothetical protein